MSVLMIIPAHNEEQNLPKVFEDIRENFPEADVLVINDCSTDHTLDVIKKYPEVKYLDLPVNLGYSFAIQTGLKYAVQEGYDHLIQFDGDGQHLAAEARKMYFYAIKNDMDIVIGSRFLEATKYHHSFFRKIGTGIFRHIIKMLTGKTISDPTSGLQVIKSNVFIPLSKIYAYPEFPDANLLIELIYQGYSIDEVPVKMKNREFGESMHGGVVEPMKYMFKMFYYIIIVYFNNLTGRKRRSKNS